MCRAHLNGNICFLLEIEFVWKQKKVETQNKFYKKTQTDTNVYPLMHSKRIFFPVSLTVRYDFPGTLNYFLVFSVRLNRIFSLFTTKKCVPRASWVPLIRFLNLMTEQHFMNAKNILSGDSENLWISLENAKFFSVDKNAWTGVVKSRIEYTENRRCACSST